MERPIRRGKNQSQPQAPKKSQAQSQARQQSRAGLQQNNSSNRQRGRMNQSRQQGDINNMMEEIDQDDDNYRRVEDDEDDFNQRPLMNAYDDALPPVLVSVEPGQAIQAVISGPPPAAPEEPPKREHPQTRMRKFWKNFEPAYLGDVVQILPAKLTEPEASTTTTKKSGSKAKSKYKSIPASEGSENAIASYKQARDTCIKHVKRIIRECHELNQKYTDVHFDLERDLKITRQRDCLDGLLTPPEDEFNPQDVKRVTEIFDRPSFYKDGAGFDDIVQGMAGDCWILAALSALTANKNLVENICVIQDQEVGVYGFVFYRDGEWHPTIIDDKLYLRAPSFNESGETVLSMYDVVHKDQERRYNRLFQRGSHSLYFAACRDENETWVPLLEKALAKAHGDYSALQGGFTGEALEDLTGGTTTEIYTTNLLNPDQFWTQNLRRTGKDFLFSCGAASFATWRKDKEDYYESYVRETRNKGIVTGHAYAILDAYEGHGQKLVKIRNPWGSKEWQGAWSDGSKEWTSEWVERLHHRFGDDGVFWMSYEDLLKKYKHMNRTRVFGPEWCIAQQWTQVQVPWNTRDYQQTQFVIEVPERTETVIVLSQLDDRYFRGLEGMYYYTLQFIIQKQKKSAATSNKKDAESDDSDGDSDSESDSDEASDFDEDDYIARSRVNYDLNRSTNVEVNLEKGKYTVLFKIEAEKWRPDQDVETVIRDNIWRREKITTIATLYDLAHAKGKPAVAAKKPEPAATPQPAPVQAAELLPVTTEPATTVTTTPVPTPAPVVAPAPTPAPAPAPTPTPASISEATPTINEGTATATATTTVATPSTTNATTGEDKTADAANNDAASAVSTTNGGEAVVVTPATTNSTVSDAAAADTTQAQPQPQPESQPQAATSGQAAAVAETTGGASSLSPPQADANPAPAQAPASDPAPGIVRARTAGFSSATIPPPDDNESEVLALEPPDEKDPQRDPWNAFCVVGLRVYSKQPGLKLKVLLPSEERPAVLDRDDIAKAALTEATENAAQESSTKTASEEGKTSTTKKSGSAVSKKKKKDKTVVKKSKKSKANKTKSKGKSKKEKSKKKEETTEDDDDDDDDDDEEEASDDEETSSDSDSD